MNIFTTLYMLTMLDSLIIPKTWLLNRYFTQVQTFDTEKIFFDKINKKRRLAPFVSPLVEGKIMESQGHTTDSFEPAYLKPKTILDPNRPLKRAVGESYAQPLSAIDRQAMALALELRDHKEMIDLRLESMAVEALIHGTITVTGEKYQTQVVDFERDSELTITLSGTEKWGETDAVPLDNLQTWAGLILKKSGAGARDVIMDIDAWNKFRKDPEVKEEIALFRGTSTMVQDATFTDGGVFMGQIQGFNIFVYSGLSENNAPLLPSGTVILVSESEIQGVRAFGAIRDEASGFQALPYFPKSWVVQDPSARIVMTQSAPLLVPQRINATLCATVL